MFAFSFLDLSYILQLPEAVYGERRAVDGSFPITIIVPSGSDAAMNLNETAFTGLNLYDEPTTGLGSSSGPCLSLSDVTGLIWPSE
jgi:hypothetical protein